MCSTEQMSLKNLIWEGCPCQPLLEESQYPLTSLRRAAVKKPVWFKYFFEFHSEISWVFCCLVFLAYCILTFWDTCLWKHFPAHGISQEPDDSIIRDLDKYHVTSFPVIPWLTKLWVRKKSLRLIHPGKEVIEERIALRRTEGPGTGSVLLRTWDSWGYCGGLIREQPSDYGGLW